MKRNVQQILTEHKGGKGVMTFEDFDLCMRVIITHLKCACVYPDGSREAKKHLKFADEICLAVEDCFVDKSSNLVNWFRREPCELYNPLIGKVVKVKVNDDFEAIYCFLHYCMLFNQDKPVSNRTFNYLALFLCELGG